MLDYNNLSFFSFQCIKNSGDSHRETGYFLKKSGFGGFSEVINV